MWQQHRVRRGQGSRSLDIVRWGRVAALAALLTLISSTPAWASAPTMFSGTSGPKYQVKPHSIYVEEPVVPVITLKWSSWSSTEAVGAGTWAEYADVNIKGHITVLVYDVKHGHFSVLRVTFTGRHRHTLVFVPGHDQNGYRAWVSARASSVPAPPRDATAVQR
jgi:hypothetical protein